MSSDTESYLLRIVLKMAIQVIIITTAFIIFSGKVNADQNNDYPMHIEEMKNLTPEPRPVTKHVPRKKKYSNKKRTKNSRCEKSSKQITLSEQSGRTHYQYRAPDGSIVFTGEPLKPPFQLIKKMTLNWGDVKARKKATNCSK